MKTVTVSASKQYDILIGNGILSSLGSMVRSLGLAEKVCVVSETNVFPLYGLNVMESLQEAGFAVSSFVFPAGEGSKNGQTFLELLDFLAREKLTRSDIIIALGGGVVGDLTGFAAASFLRGIRFIQIPTTLLAAVDSSVGGKTAIDLPSGKNLAGAFYQPNLVLCDTDTLRSLPEEIFRDGCAEVIKYGILFDPDLFKHLEQNGLDFDREWVIMRCVERKRDVVMEDEFDVGLRMKLNLGHTLAHGIEGRSGFTVSHGRAVAIGTAMIARAGKEKGLCPDEVCARILEVLTRFGLPTESPYGSQELLSYTLSDKKRSGSTVKLIVPRAIGQCDIVPTPVGEMLSWIEAGY